MLGSSATPARGRNRARTKQTTARGEGTRSGKVFRGVRGAPVSKKKKAQNQKKKKKKKKGKKVTQKKKRKKNKRAGTSQHTEPPDNIRTN